MQKQSKTKYKVRDMVTGLYQESGFGDFPQMPNVTWSEKGKMWTKISDLQEHFDKIQSHNIPISPLWEVVEFASAKKEIASYPATPFASTKSR